MTTSLIPAIKEGERFIQFLNKRFELNLDLDLVLTFHKMKKTILGSFYPKTNSDCFTNGKISLHSISINTLHLKENPYETLAHELVHYVNRINEVKDCSSNQYHNKHFKSLAEKFLLKVEKQKGRGWANTSPTEEFNKMLSNEFKKDDTAFSIFQNLEEKQTKQTTRNYLFTCENECFKVRCGDKEFNGFCSCGRSFEIVEK